MTEKKGTCMKLREQLDVLEKETAAKLSELDQYNKDMQVGISHYYSIIRAGVGYNRDNVS